MVWREGGVVVVVVGDVLGLEVLVALVVRVVAASPPLAHAAAASTRARSAA
jgi:hypothetical protein